MKQFIGSVILSMLTISCMAGGDLNKVDQLNGAVKDWKKWGEMRKMLDEGVNPSTLGNDGESALHWAAMYQGHGGAALLKLLLSYPSVNINVRNVLGQTPLYLAAGNKDSDAGSFKQLLQMGADPAILSNKNANALHFAADRGNITASFALLDKDPSLLKQINSFGGTPYHSAIRNDHWQAAGIIKDYAIKNNMQNALQPDLWK